MLSEQFHQYEIARDLAGRVPDAITEASDRLGELTLYVTPSRIVEICRFLKDERSFVRLSSVTAVDWVPAEPRFEIVYHLHSLDRNERLRLKCRVAEES